MGLFRRSVKIGLWILFSCVLWLSSAPDVALASDPPVATGLWATFDNATPNYPGDAPVVSMAVDSGGRLWIGTDGDGVAMYDGFTWTQYTVSNTSGGLLSDNVFFLTAFSGVIWIGGPNGISVYNSVTNQWSKFTTAEGLPTNDIRGVVVKSGFPSDKYYFGTAGMGVVVCNIDIFEMEIVDCPSSESETQANGKLPSDSVTRIVGSGYDRWIVTSNGTVHVVDHEGTPDPPEIRTTYGPGTTGCPDINWANNITLDYLHDRVWITLSGGLFGGDPVPGLGACVFDRVTETWRHFNTGNSGLGDNSVVDVAVDREGRAWFGAMGQQPGVYVYTWITDTCCWKTYKVDSPGVQLASNFVRSAIANLDRVYFGHLNALSSVALHWQAFEQEVWALASLPGELLVGTPAGLLSFDGTSFTTLLPNVDVRAIFAPSPDEMWIGTHSGLFHWDGQDWVQFTTDNSGVASNQIKSIARDNLDRIWAATSASGVSVYNPANNSWVTFDPTNALPSYVMGGVIANEAGDVWLATAQGVSHYNGSNFATYKVGAGLPSDNVPSIGFDAEGRVWAGTVQGPALFVNGSWTTASGTFPKNLILQVHGLASGGVWFGMVGGARFNDNTFPFQRYRASNSGLGTDQPVAITSDAEGAVWFGAPPTASPPIVPGGLFVRSVDPEPLGEEVPAITRFSPISGSAGVTVTISGSGFQPGSKVFFGANSPTSGVLGQVISQTGTTIVALLPSNAIKGKMRVTNAIGAATSTDDFSPIPVITAIDPATGPIGLPIKIFGTNLQSLGFSEVKFGNSVYSSLIISTSLHNLIEAVVPSDASSGAVKVKTSSGEATGPQFTLSSGGLKLLDWEVHQGLPQYQNLVANKSTVVRLFLGSDAPGGCAYVTGALLQVLGPGTNHTNWAETLTTGGIPNGGWFCGMTKQDAAGGSIDFVVPGEYLDKGKINFAASFSSRFVNLFDKVLGDYIFTPTDDLRVHIAAPGWEHWSDPAVYGPMTEEQTGLHSFNRQLVNFNRIYPVRDGTGGILTENGLRWILNPNFVFCNGVDDGFCRNAGDTYSVLYDFWQENLGGIQRLCMIPTRFPANTTHAGNVLSFKHSFKPGELKRIDFVVLVRPGAALPADLNTLVSYNTGSTELIVESRENVKQLKGPSTCPMTTYTDMFVVRARIRNTGQNTFTGHTITATYDDSKLNAAANGGMVLGNGNTPESYTVPGQFFIIDGSQSEMYDPPMDMNYDGAIDGTDFPIFIAEFDDWNPASGDFVTSKNVNLVGPKDVLRNFLDANGNQSIDTSETWAPFLERHRDKYVRYAIYDVPRNYRNAFNATSPVKAQFSQLWLWDRANPFDLMGLGGQAPGNETMWADMADHSAIVHETGHNTGLPHSEEFGIPNIPAGYNTVKRSVVVGSDLRSAMSPAVTWPIENVFFNPLQYHYVYNFFRNQYSEDSVQSAAAGQTPTIYLSGLIGQDGEVEITSSYRSTQLPTTPLDPAGNYWLRLVGDDGILANYRFDVEFEVEDLAEGEAQPQMAPFEVTQPWVNGTVRIEIWDSSHRLYQLAVSAAAPSVTVQSPNGGENVAANGTLSVQWSGSDADGDTLTYAVYYSPDNGTSWLTLAAATSETEITVPAASLPGSGSALVSVTATDGVNVGSDRSNAIFQVAGKGPQWVAIVAPTAAQEVVQSQRQTLVGTAYDLEDGQLAGSQLSWYSDQVGALGTGETLSVTLPVGVHQLTLVAKDSANMTVSRSITISVLDDFDGDGLADAYEEQYGELAWWNPDDAGEDPDGDGLTSRSEAAWGTDPGDADSDGDGVSDGDEAAAGSLPNDPSSKPQAARVLASAQELHFAMARGGANPAATTLLLMSSTPAETSWSAQTQGSWLTVDVKGGETPTEVTVSVNGAGLPVGVHQGEIVFSGGAEPWTIPVTLIVADPSAPSMKLRLPMLAH
jgi:ligand-binding sensor domain-containing protein